MNRAECIIAVGQDKKA